MRNENVKILITGGSGFIGTCAIEEAISRSYDVINFDIKKPRNSTHNDYWWEVDIRDMAVFSRAVADFQPTHILHLAAKTGMDIKHISVLDANTVGVQNLIDISKNIDSLKRIVFTSSLLVCKNGYIPTNETDFCPPNLYGESKVLGEKYVRAADMNCEWVIVRPTSIWGPWFEHSYKAFFQTIDKNRYVHIGEEEFQKPAAYVGNAVFVMMKLLFGNEVSIVKGTFYITDYPWYSTRKWADTIQTVLGSRRIRTVPLWLLRAVARSGDLLKLVLRYDPPLTSFRLNNMLTGGVYPDEKTQQLCGELPFNLNCSVFETAQWMYENKLIKHKPREM